MALAIDAKHLAENCMPRVQRDLDKLDGNTDKRFQVLRLCVHATVIQDAASTARRLSEAGGDLQVAMQEDLDWQADQDEELNDLKVLECLRRQATTSPLFNAGFSTGDFATTLTATCAWAISPALAVRAQGRSLSSDFHRYSLRSSFLACYDGHPSSRFYGVGSGDPNVIPQFAVKYDEWVHSASLLRILGASDKPYVIWRLQCDIVDLLRPKPSSHSGRRRKTAEDPCLQLSGPPVEEETSEGNRFNGVRYRSDRRRWIAEMKPPKKKNKYSFGDFKSPAEAARVVDAAFHHYDKPNLLNFPDSPGILSKRPSPAAALNDEDKLRFVKAEAKWLASIVFSLPSSLPSESENAIVDPLSPARSLGSSSVQITEGWNAADDSSPDLSNCVNLLQNSEIQTPWMPYFVMSPAIPTVPVPPSPRNFQDEVVRGLLELQREFPMSFDREEALEVDTDVVFDDNEELRY